MHTPNKKISTFRMKAFGPIARKLVKLPTFKLCKLQLLAHVKAFEKSNNLFVIHRTIYILIYLLLIFCTLDRLTGTQSSDMDDSLQEEEQQVHGGLQIYYTSLNLKFSDFQFIFVLQLFHR